MSQIPIQQALQIAVQHHQAGRLSEADTIYRQIVAQYPNHPAALQFLGMLEGQLGRLDVAVELIRRAIAIYPSEASYHSNLGKFLLDKGEPDAAVVACREAVRLKPDFADAWYNLGNALKEQGDLEEAIKSFREVVRIKPDDALVYSNLFLSLQCRSMDGRSIYEEACRWAQRHGELLRKEIQPHLNDRNPDRKLRIGYVSTDFARHSCAYFLIPLFGHHDREKVEVIVYADVQGPDDITRWLRERAQLRRSTIGRSDADVTELIRTDGIDILVDLKLHTEHNRLLVFARKPAPVQVTWLAYPGTTGLSTMDYRLTDAYLDPPGESDGCYSEESIRLPDCFWCYDPLGYEFPVGPPPALANGYVTFGCLNTFAKISPQVLQTWSKLLASVPGSRLLLHAFAGSHRERVWRQLESAGVERSRCSFVGLVPAAEYFRLYQKIDIALDSFPFAGGTTTCNALWMGVPVVTFAGTTVVGRGGVSILSNVGLPELVAAQTAEEYVEIAGKLAKGLPRLTELRACLRQRMKSSPLMDGARFARNMEAAYRTMWRRWCAASQEGKK